MTMLGSTGLIIGLYGVVFHEEFDGDIHKLVAPLVYRFLSILSSFIDVFSIFAIFVFRPFLERQGSYGAENLMTDRSRGPRHFVSCMLGASAAKRHRKTQKTFKNFAKTCEIYSITRMVSAQ